MRIPATTHHASVRLAMPSLALLALAALPSVPGWAADVTEPTSGAVTLAGQAIDPSLPTLVDFGMGMCVDCMRMEKELKELRDKCAGQINVVYVNIQEKPEIGRAYGVTLIPMQALYDTKQQERTRHVGFWPAGAILEAFAAFEINVSPSSPFSPVTTPTPAPMIQAGAPVEATEDQAIPDNYTGTVLFLFYSEERCPCNFTITEGARAVVTDQFRNELDLKKILIREFCIEEEEHEHYVEDYDLSPEYHLHNGVVLTRFKDGKPGEWKKLEECDFLKDDDEQLDCYLKKEVTEFLLGKKNASTPFLLAFGMENCAPCKQMAPVLEELRARICPAIRIEEIEATRRPDVTKRFGVRVMPTQVLFDCEGVEKARHEGVWPLEAILEAVGRLPVLASNPAKAIPPDLAVDELFDKLTSATVVNADATTLSAQPASSGAKYIVYYLHAEFRSGCSADLEETAQSVITEELVKVGVKTLPWETINVDESNDSRWEKAYHLDLGKHDLTRGVALLVEQSAGKPVRWVLIGDLADYREDLDALDEYVRDLVKRFL